MILIISRFLRSFSRYLSLRPKTGLPALVMLGGLYAFSPAALASQAPFYTVSPAGVPTEANQACKSYAASAGLARPSDGYVECRLQTYASGKSGYQPYNYSSGTREFPSAHFPYFNYGNPLSDAVCVPGHTMQFTVYVGPNEYLDATAAFGGCQFDTGGMIDYRPGPDGGQYVDLFGATATGQQATSSDDPQPGTDPGTDPDPDPDPGTDPDPDPDPGTDPDPDPGTDPGTGGGESSFNCADFTVDTANYKLCEALRVIDGKARSIKFDTKEIQYIDTMVEEILQLSEGIDLRQRNMKTNIDNRLLELLSASVNAAARQVEDRQAMDSGFSGLQDSINDMQTNGVTAILADGQLDDIDQKLNDIYADQALEHSWIESDLEAVRAQSDAIMGDTFQIRYAQAQALDEINGKIDALTLAVDGLGSGEPGEPGGDPGGGSAGGLSCDQLFYCDGDAIACASLEFQRTRECDAEGFASYLQVYTSGVGDLGDEGLDLTQNQDIDVSESIVDWAAVSSDYVGQCPQPRTIELNFGGTQLVKFDAFCDFANQIRPFVIFMFTFLGGAAIARTAIGRGAP